MNKQPWWQLLSIQAAGALCLPVIVVGQLVCQKYGWLAACLCLGIGNLFLLGIGLVFSALSTEKPQSTVEQAGYYFGNRGKGLFAWLMILSMLGWFAIQLNMMSLSVSSLCGGIGNLVAWNCGIGGLLIGSMCFGMKGMKWLSNIAAPLMVGTLMCALYFSSDSVPQSTPLSLSFLGGVSLIIGANMGAVIDLPTFFRYARSKRDAQICMWLLFGLIVPLIEGVGVFLAAMSEETSLLGVLQGRGGLLWGVWVSCFVLFAGWTTNNANLYSAVVSSYSLGRKSSSVGRTLSFGLVGVVVACLNPLGSIEVVLNGMGIAIGAMGAVMLTNFLFKRRASQVVFLSWLFGVGVGSGCAAVGVVLTGVPILDAFFGAALMQWVLSERRGGEKNYGR